MLAGLGSAATTTPGCLMTESILLQDSLSTAVYPCEAEVRPFLYSFLSFPFLSFPFLSFTKPLLKTNDLSRQARDKRREDSKRRAFHITQGRLGLGTWKKITVSNSNITKYQLAGDAKLLAGAQEYCLGAWIARGVSNARLVSCSDPSAAWAGQHTLPAESSGGGRGGTSGGAGGATAFHLVASAKQAASQAQQDFATTECLDACHKGECVRDVSPTIVY